MLVIVVALVIIVVVERLQLALVVITAVITRVMTTMTSHLRVMTKSMTSTTLRKYCVGVGRTVVSCRNVAECAEIEGIVNLDYGSCRLLDCIMAQNFGWPRMSPINRPGLVIKKWTEVYASDRELADQYDWWTPSVTVVECVYEGSERGCDQVSVSVTSWV